MWEQVDVPGRLLPSTTWEVVVSSLGVSHLTCLRSVILLQEGASQRTLKVDSVDIGVVVDTAKSQCGQSSPPRFRRRSIWVSIDINSACRPMRPPALMVYWTLRSRTPWTTIGKLPGLGDGLQWLAVRIFLTSAKASSDKHFLELTVTATTMSLPWHWPFSLLVNAKGL